MSPCTSVHKGANMYRLIVTLGLMVSLLFADSEPNDSCTQAEIITALDGASPTKDITISGTVHQNNDRYDYYTFTVGESGILDFYFSGNKTYSSLFIGSTCDGDEYYSNTSNSYNKNPSAFNVSAGDTIYIKIERRYDTLMNYELDIEFEELRFTGTNFKDFEILYSENLRGDIRMIGNSIVGEWDTEWYWSWWGWQQRYINNTTCPGNNTNNAIVASRFWDVDNNASTFNSSSAELSIPAGSTIKKAYLYWQGRAASNEYKDAKVIKFKPPGASGYTTITASDDNMHWDSYGDYYPYQGSAEVTEYINGSGTYTVADLTTYAGNAADRNGYFPDGLGAYGAWSLVVVYENDDENLQNITIYNGYKTIALNNSEDFTLSGFMTPLNGDVNSKFLVFTGEGDVDLSKDYVNLNGTRLTRFDDNKTDSNTFNASITDENGYVTSRDPDCQNNFGIDIHTYDVGTNGLGIIDNNQTSATLEIGTNQDRYYLSVFAFATQLYEPRVCYFIDTIKSKDSNETIFENKSFVGDIEPDKEYVFDIWISNMKKSADDGFIETAELVEVYMDMNNIEYFEDSTQMKNIGQSTYSYQDDLFDFNLSQNLSTYRVGIGASSNQGGTIAPAENFDDDSKKAFIKFEGKFSVDENATSIDLVDFFDFSASFKAYDIVIGPDEALAIDQCRDLDTEVNIIRPPQGAFDVVNENFSGNSLNSAQDTALYTQVANNSFNVKVVALDNDYETLKSYSGDIEVSVIKTPDYSKSNDELNEQLCSDATSLKSQTVSFKGEKFITVPFTIENAYQKLSFQVSYDSNGETKYVCSTDSFAVRPAEYEVTTPITKLIGGTSYTIDTAAVDASGNITTHYSHTSSNAMQSIELITPPGCSVAADTDTEIITFSSGVSENIIKTSNIGDYNITIIDTDWTSIDYNNLPDGRTDCIVGSSSTSHVNGKVGCDIQTTEVLSFYPQDFLINMQVNNFNNDIFTYVSNDKEMSASINFDVIARLGDANKSVATAYDGNCYANEITSEITLLESTPKGWGSNQSNAIDRILFFETSNATLDSNSTGSATFITSEGNFTLGTAANLEVLFNFDRDPTTPDAPFIVLSKDFNITVVDTANTKSADFSPAIDDETNFYYGRVFAPDQQGAPSPINDVPIYYEVYCGTCNQADHNITGSAGVEDPNWFINIHHDDLSQGKVDTFSSVESTQLSKTGIGQSDTIATRAGDISNGVERINLHEVNHRVDRIVMDPDSWLVYAPGNSLATTNDFWVKFTSEGSWVGEGTVDKDQSTVKIGTHTHETDNNTTLKRENRRINW